MANFVLVFPGDLIKHKPLISEECSTRVLGSFKTLPTNSTSVKYSHKNHELDRKRHSKL